MNTRCWQVRPVGAAANAISIPPGKVEILTPGEFGESFVVEEIYNEGGEAIDGCPHPGMMCKVKVPFKVGKNSFIRKELV